MEKFLSQCQWLRTFWDNLHGQPFVDAMVTGLTAIIHFVFVTIATMMYGKRVLWQMGKSGLSHAEILQEWSDHWQKRAPKSKAVGGWFLKMAVSPPGIQSKSAAKYNSIEELCGVQLNSQLYSSCCYTVVFGRDRHTLWDALVLPFSMLVLSRKEKH